MAIRWQFIEDHEHGEISWAWRLMGADETIEQHSPQFSNYGAAVNDAIRHGFRPPEQHWIVVTPGTITHFRHGAKPVTVPVAAEGPEGIAAILRLRGKNNPYARRRVKAAPSGKKTIQQ